MNILHKAKDYVEILFKDKLSSVYFYHNFIHTTYTVNKAEEIMRNTPVSKEDQEKVLLALWFHDTGYVECAQNHEEKGVTILTDFLKQENYPESYIEDVSRLILQPKLPISRRTFWKKL
ncbi:hypothetical protein BN1195_02813 [Chryseobacterium oranimense G311]|uniref:HD domain-containing protein n=1 Tax=Chryseobacterium oranimense TaxID=421058 RepID=UPI00053399AD|nr:hypothetical protein BN1195_02813 [Chryseobacterium oranimense G311]